MTWTKGRQGGGYYNYKIFQLFKSDAYLIKYPPGSGIAWHIDEVKGHKHYRLNIRLWPLFERESLIIKGKPLLQFGPFTLFRPDYFLHRVIEIPKHTRYVLSIGWAVRTKK